MVGMLPGVECARRRRLHQSRGGSMATHNSTRRSFSLYPTNNMEFLLSSSSSSLLARRLLNEAYPDDDDEKLGGAAREAKQRLDDKLGGMGAHRRSEKNQKHEQQRKSLFHGLCMQL